MIKDPARQAIVVAIRGTQSFRDLIVDLEMDVATLQLPHATGVKGTTFICHTGILRAAQALIEPHSKLMRILRAELEAEPSFGLVLTGHSLGGAIASAVAVLLANLVQSAEGNNVNSRWVTTPTSGLPPHRPMRAISFAPPATMSPDLAAWASRGTPPLVLAATLGPDIIPRCGHGQARELRRVLGALARLRATMVLPVGTSTPRVDAQARRAPILRTWVRWYWTMRQLQRNSTNSSRRADLVLRATELSQQLYDIREAIEEDLYASVKARLTLINAQPTPPSPWLNARPSLHELASRRQVLDRSTLKNEERLAGAGVPMLIPAGWNVWMSYAPRKGAAMGLNDPLSRPTSGSAVLELYHVRSPETFFSLPWLHPKLFAAHFPSAYENALLEDLHG